MINFARIKAATAITTNSTNNSEQDDQPDNVELRVDVEGDEVAKLC